MRAPSVAVLLVVASEAAALEAAALAVSEAVAEDVVYRAATRVSEKGRTGEKKSELLKNKNKVK